MCRRGWYRQFRKMLSYHVIRQALEYIGLILGRKNFEAAEAYERGRDTADDSAHLGLWIAVVKHIAHHRFTRCNQAQCARRRHPEIMHGFAAQELAD